MKPYFKQYDSVSADLERIFGALFNPTSEVGDTTTPKSHINETPTHFESDTYKKFKSENGESGLKLFVRLPGIEKENVNVFVEDNILNVEFSNTEESENGSVKKLYKKAFTIPNNLQKDNIDASLHLGILEIKLLNKPERKPVSINIK